VEAGIILAAILCLVLIFRQHLTFIRRQLSQFSKTIEKQEKKLHDQNTTLHALTQRLHNLEAGEDAGQKGHIMLAEERLLLRTLIDALPDLIYIKDTQHRFVIVNKALVEYLGQTTADEIIGKSDADLLEPELAQRYYQDERTVFETGEPLLERVEPGIDRRTQETRWFLSTKVPFYDHQGNIRGILGIGRDITRRKQAEDAVKEMNKGLEKRLQRHV
jgi:PAS domain S-box-containing protein